MEHIIKNSHVQFAIALKLQQLQRNELASLTLEHLEDTLFGFTWRYKKPKSLHEAVNDILTLQISEIVAYLSNQAIIEGAQMNLSDLQDVIGGN
ncbi:MAG: post-transcriptional regulator [Erysipelotrichaceae bacterium]